MNQDSLTQPAPKFVPMDETLVRYIISHSPMPHPILAEVAQKTQQMVGSMMQISADQGAFMYTIAKILGASHALEIGCFTGYSAICVASGLTPAGKLITIDPDESTNAVAKEFFKKAGLQYKIDLRSGKGLDILDSLAEETGPNYFDITFIDADKKNMRNYYERILPLTRAGGIILVDNVLWSGRVARPDELGEETMAIKSFNDFVANDDRVDRVLLSIADGIYLLRKR